MVKEPYFFLIFYIVQISSYPLTYFITIYIHTDVCVYVFFPIRIQFRPLSLEVAQVKSSGSPQLCSVPFLHFSFKHELRAGDANILAMDGRRMVLHCLGIPAPSIIQDRSIHIPERERERGALQSKQLIAN